MKSSYPFPTRTINWNSTRMDIPVLLGVHIYGPLSIVTGPVFSNVSKYDIEGLDSYSASVLYEKNVMSLQAGILLEIGRFGVDVRYEYGMNKVEKQENLDFTRAGNGGTGVNLANFLEFNPSQLIVSIHINIVRFNPNEKKRSSRS